MAQWGRARPQAVLGASSICHRSVLRFSLEPDSIPNGLPATLDTSLDGEITETRPATIRVAFECTADDARTFRFGYPCPFADTVGVEENGSRLVLQYEASTADRDRGCWQTGTLDERGVTERRTFDPGSRAVVEWSVLNYAENESCFPTGRYRFEDAYGVDGRTYEWGFCLRVR
ncbi:hypothetical protein [Haladaptatus caseinilyticus]|uniref:hypothetical protein n=1 Tax=Haladaptatus caseinilyticus TaxID=2993314 RepID=UPI00224B2D1E|nr:hypothetical protein [Haladaptatus caseinilyticus]